MTFPHMLKQYLVIFFVFGEFVAGISYAALADTSDPTPLDRELRSVLNSPVLERVLTGVHVRRLSDGKTLFSHNGRRLFNPASNMKLLTTAAALWYLGPSYRFRTQVRRSRAMAGRTVKGDLYVEARGDPTLTTENLFGLANQIALAGVSAVQGNLVIDDTFFDQVTEGPGWDQEVGDHAYNAPISAFSVNFNTFVARVIPGDRPGARAKISLWPPVESLSSEVTAVTRGKNTRTRLWFGTSRRPDDGVRITVRGHIAKDDTRGRSLRRRIHKPTQFAGEALRYLLKIRGVKIEGKIVQASIDEQRTTLVARRVSRPLGAIVSTLNKYSNNFIAEQILKTLAAEVEGRPGTWEKGQIVLKRFLSEIGIKPNRVVLGNGSGLNDVNRLTPEQITHILQVMHSRFELAPEYVSSLGVAGESGTISARFEDTAAVSRLRAKTGTLTGVSALSGYVATIDDELLAFSVIMNNYRGRARTMWNIQERIGAILAQHRYHDDLATTSSSPKLEAQ
ncbi:MAG: D-alanyl-D-alanine carboxypeptidase/D-alanyl-D-alanine-endopeptidase [Myxococcales bacterium]|nr:D-alanyl-D-alanine carboxypeptidase/D-alanyl-D-alanine-endopeptidase [Myxococcales bacterium]